MPCTECSHCKPPSPKPDEPKYKGSQLRSHPKLFYYAQWLAWILFAWLFCWAAFSVQAEDFEPTVQNLDSSGYLALPEYFSTVLRVYFDALLADRVVGTIIGTYIILYLSCFLSGYLFARKGYKAAHGNPSGDAKMAWLKDRMRETETGRDSWYNIYTNKLRISHYLLNPNGYHGAVFYYREFIYAAFFWTISTYSLVVFLLYFPADISILIICGVLNWFGFVLWLWLTLVTARCNGWFLATGIFVTELRNEFENSEKILSKRKCMEGWIERFLAEERLDAGEELASFERCIEDILSSFR